MAIMGPADLPSIMKMRTEPMKKYIFSKLGYPVVDVELTEDQLETVFKVCGDFIAQYFPREQKLAVFWTTPLKNTYPLPKDAYCVQEISWDAFTNRVDDIFGAQASMFNMSMTGSQGTLLDYHLLAAYRKFSQKILGSEGHWEVINEGKSTVDGDSLSSKDQLIRLYPTPKGAFPVTVMYIPVVTHFRSAQARQLAYDMMLAEAKIMLGMSRRKISGMPTPDGGSLALDGSDLVQEGEAAREKIIEMALNLGEPLMIHMWSIIIFTCLLIGSFGDII